MTLDSIIKGKCMCYSIQRFEMIRLYPLFNISSRSKLATYYKSQPKLLWNADRGSGIPCTSMAVIRHVSRAILLMISNLIEYRSTLKLSKVIKAIFQ